MTTLTLAKQLLTEQSITPDDKKFRQKILAARLRTIGFEIEEMHFGNTKKFLRQTR